MLRNREFRQFAICFLIIAAVSILLAFTVNQKAGILSVLSVAAFGISFTVFTKVRYQRIAKLSDEIDMVLHNTEHVYIGESDEGELSILQCEIMKMTVRIREQNDALKKEKELLADSTADIAHQLRTPLTSVNLILSLLENNPNEKERRALIRETEELLVQMDWLLTSMLKISRLDAGIIKFQNEQIEVKQLISNAQHPFLIAMELHNIAIHSDVTQGIYIQGDAGWISEAIQNILKNCMESAGENGKIMIACKDNPLFTEITIHDSGPGFAEEDVRKLFERFYRGKNDGATGYGIGLALCRMIIMRQGGTVTAKNHPEGGALFSIRFSK